MSGDVSLEVWQRPKRSPKFRRFHSAGNLVVGSSDGGNAGELVVWLWPLRPQPRTRLGIVKRRKLRGGFHMLPMPWIVERTFGWLTKFRRLRADYERLTTRSRAVPSTGDDPPRPAQGA